MTLLEWVRETPLKERFSGVVDFFSNLKNVILARFPGDTALVAALLFGLSAWLCVFLVRDGGGDWYFREEAQKRELEFWEKEKWLIERFWLVIGKGCIVMFGLGFILSILLALYLILGGAV